MSDTRQTAAEKRMAAHGAALVKPTIDARNNHAEYERRVKAAVNNINKRIPEFAEEKGWHFLTREFQALNEALAIVNEEFEILDGIDLSLGEKREE